MKYKPLTAAVYAAFLTGSLLSLFAGPTGVTAQKRLQSMNHSLEEHLNELKTIQSDLQKRFDVLRSDPGAVTVEARALGLFYEDELVLYFNDSVPRNRPYNTGDVLQPAPAESGSGGLIWIFTAMTGLIVLVIFLSAGRLKRHAG